MDESTINKMEIDYQKGFNQGYVVAKHLPELGKTLAEVKSISPQMEGFRDGREQFLLEKSKDRLPNWMKRDYSKEPGIGNKDNKGPDLSKE